MMNWMSTLVLLMVMAPKGCIGQLLTDALDLDCTLCEGNRDPLFGDVAVSATFNCAEFKQMVPTWYNKDNCNSEAMMKFRKQCGCPQPCRLCEGKPGVPDPSREVTMTTGNTVTCQELEDAALYLDSSTGTTSQTRVVQLQQSCASFQEDHSILCCSETVEDNNSDTEGPAPAPTPFVFPPGTTLPPGYEFPGLKAGDPIGGFPLPPGMTIPPVYLLPTVEPDGTPSIWDNRPSRVPSVTWPPASSNTLLLSKALVLVTCLFGAMLLL